MKMGYVAYLQKKCSIITVRVKFECVIDSKNLEKINF